MKTTCTLLLLACALCACDHHDSRNDARRYNNDRSIRRTDDTRRHDTRTRQRTPRRDERPSTDDWDKLPYLPSFTMR